VYFTGSTGPLSVPDARLLLQAFLHGHNIVRTTDPKLSNDCFCRDILGLHPYAARDLPIRGPT
jgi:hypothetical protein